MGRLEDWPDLAGVRYVDASKKDPAAAVQRVRENFYGDALRHAVEKLLRPHPPPGTGA